jgi:hypothetical protein
MAILDCFEARQAGVKERLQIIFVLACSDGVYDLIAIEVGKKFWRGKRVIAEAVRRPPEKDTVEASGVMSAVRHKIC